MTYITLNILTNHVDGRMNDDSDSDDEHNHGIEIYRRTTRDANCPQFPTAHVTVGHVPSK